MAENPEWVTVVAVGPLGGMTVSGRRRTDGTWELRSSSTSMTLDSNDDEEWINSTRPVSSLAEAFEASRSYFGVLVPREPVHPEFREAMLAIIQKLAPGPGGFACELWERRNRAEWLRACASEEAEKPKNPPRDGRAH
jgi:hypothetical protein